MNTTTQTIEFDTADRADRADPADTGRRGADRRAYRRTIRAFRSRRVLSASLVAVLLAAAAALTAIESISHLVDEPLGLLPTGWSAEFARDTTWDQAVILVAAIVVGLVGLLLLALAFLPGRARAVPARAGHDDVLLAVRPTALERHAVRAAESTAGVTRAGASMNRSRLRVRADSGLHEPGELADEIRRAVTDRIAQFDLLRPPRVQVELKYREE